MTDNENQRPEWYEYVLADNLTARTHTLAVDETPVHPFFNTGQANLGIIEAQNIGEAVSETT
jgi:hypothetical protein